jgi:hypothetical protein
MGGGEHHPQPAARQRPLRRHHHPHRGRAGQRLEHLGVAGEVPPAGVEGGLVDRGGDDPPDRAGEGELHGALDRRPRHPAGRGGRVPGGPGADRDLLGPLDQPLRADQEEVGGLAHGGLPQRLGDDLGADAARVAQGDGQRGT